MGGAAMSPKTPTSKSPTRSGKPYLALTLMDSSGAIEARLWDRAEFFAPQAREGAFVRVSATVE